MNGRKLSGDRAEQLAADFLVSRGYEIKQRNYHSRYGEIDIIAQNERYIAFVEVKQRSSTKYGLPREAVNRQKQKKIILTAYKYIQQYGFERQPRFDVIEIYTNKITEKAEKLIHIKGAFEVNGDEASALF